jgi:hypothetical protein
MRGSAHAWLAGLAGPNAGQRIADLGGGRGPTLVELADRWLTDVRTSAGIGGFFLNELNFLVEAAR